MVFMVQFHLVPLDPCTVPRCSWIVVEKTKQNNFNGSFILLRLILKKPSPRRARNSKAQEFRSIIWRADRNLVVLELETEKIMEPFGTSENEPVSPTPTPLTVSPKLIGHEFGPFVRLIGESTTAAITNCFFLFLKLFASLLVVHPPKLPVRISDVDRIFSFLFFCSFSTNTIVCSKCHSLPRLAAAISSITFQDSCSLLTGRNTVFLDVLIFQSESTGFLFIFPPRRLVYIFSP